MKVKVNKKHVSEGNFPLFKAGSTILVKDECNEFVAWYNCEIEGYSTYIHNLINGNIKNDQGNSQQIFHNNSVFLRRTDLSRT